MFDLYHYSDADKKAIIASMVILVDTREKKGHNDHILNYFDEKNVGYKNKQLNYGDYSFMIPENEKFGILKPLYFDKKIVIERKHNLDELASNLATDRERLRREFALAPENKVLLIENASYEDMINGKYRSQYAPQSYWATLHSFWHQFNLPFVFIKDENYTAKFMIGYFGYYLKNIMQ